jgi:hypothetical protein
MKFTERINLPRAPGGSRNEPQQWRSANLRFDPFPAPILTRSLFLVPRVRHNRSRFGNQTAAYRHSEGIAMHYTFCIITSAGRGAMNMETLFSTTNPEHVAELKQCVQEQGRDLRRKAQGRNVREVVVTNVDGKEHGRWCSQPGRNGLSSRSVQQGQVFRSATEASGHVGLRHNEVAMVLSRAAAAGEQTAKVRGVTFAYRDRLLKGNQKPAWGQATTLPVIPNESNQNQLPGKGMEAHPGTEPSRRARSGPSRF